MRAIVKDRQFTLGDLFGWLLIFSAFFTVIGSYSIVVVGLQQQTVAWPRVLPPAVCWLVLFVYFVRKRHYAALVVHTAPATLLTAVMITSGYNVGGIVTMAACWLSTAISFPTSLFKSLGSGIQRDVPPSGYLAYQLLTSVFLVSAICTAFPTMFRGVVHWPSIAFGALLGMWVGFYQAVATSPQLAGQRLCGLPTRPTATAGFLSALFGPMLCWWANRYVFSNTAQMLWLTPLLCGLPAALIVGLVARQLQQTREEG